MVNDIYVSSFKRPFSYLIGGVSQAILKKGGHELSQLLLVPAASKLLVFDIWLFCLYVWYKLKTGYNSVASQRTYNYTNGKLYFLVVLCPDMFRIAY